MDMHNYIQPQMCKNCFGKEFCSSGQVKIHNGYCSNWSPIPVPKYPTKEQAESMVACHATVCSECGAKEWCDDRNFRMVLGLNFVAMHAALDAKQAELDKTWDPTKRMNDGLREWRKP